MDYYAQDRAGPSQPQSQSLRGRGDETLEQDLRERYDFEYQNTAGSEPQGTVATSRQTGSKVMIRKVQRSSLQAAADIDRDITARAAVNDASILLLIESLELKDVIWTVIEYKPLQTASQLVSLQGPMGDEALKTTLNQLFSGIAALFYAGFAHLRICEKTICFDKSGQLIISDLQYACEYGKEKTDDLYASTREKFGDDIWVAPEVFAALEYNARKAVIWSCGVLLYYLATGQTEKLSVLDHPSFDKLHQEPQAAATPKSSSRRWSSAVEGQSSHRRMSSASTQSKFILSLNRTNMPNYARWIIPRMLTQDPLRRPELIEVASRVPKDYSDKAARPLIEMAWLDYKTHVGPLAGLDIPSPNRSSASSLYSMASAMSNPLKSLLGKSSSRRQSAPMAPGRSGW